jgi:hypothetical protein
VSGKNKEIKKGRRGRVKNDEGEGWHQHNCLPVVVVIRSDLAPDDHQRLWW